MTDDNESNFDASRLCRMTGHLLGWLSLAWSLFVFFRACQIASIVERLYPPHTVMNLGVSYASVTGLSMMGVVGSLILGAVGIGLRRGKLGAWIITLMAIATALAAHPVGRYVLDRAVVANGYMDGG